MPRKKQDKQDKIQGSGFFGKVMTFFRGRRPLSGPEETQEQIVMMMSNTEKQKENRELSDRERFKIQDITYESNNKKEADQYLPITTTDKKDFTAEFKTLNEKHVDDNTLVGKDLNALGENLAIHVGINQALGMEFMRTLDSIAQAKKNENFRPDSSEYADLSFLQAYIHTDQDQNEKYIVFDFVSDEIAPEDLLDMSECNKFYERLILMALEAASLNPNFGTRIYNHMCTTADQKNGLYAIGIKLDEFVKTFKQFQSILSEEDEVKKNNKILSWDYVSNPTITYAYDGKLVDTSQITASYHTVVNTGSMKEEETVTPRTTTTTTTTPRRPQQPGGAVKSVASLDPDNPDDTGQNPNPYTFNK